MSEAWAAPGVGLRKYPSPPPGASHALVTRSFSCTVFTFGQTGSGKTYTLTGPPPQVSNWVELHLSPPPPPSVCERDFWAEGGVVKEIPPYWFVYLVSEEGKAPPGSCRVWNFQLIRLWGGTDELLTEIPMILWGGAWYRF